MEKQSFEQIKDYGAALAIITHLFRRELITTDEYHLLITKLKPKCNRVTGSPEGLLALSPLQKTKTEGRF